MDGIPFILFSLGLGVGFSVFPDSSFLSTSEFISVFRARFWMLTSSGWRVNPFRIKIFQSVENQIRIDFRNPDRRLRSEPCGSLIETEST